MADSGSMKKILVIIPTYNEVENIGRVVDAIEQIAFRLSSYSLSLLIVDDNSPDGTSGQVKTLQSKYSNIHLLTGHKSGLGKAYIRAFRYALRRSGFDAFIMMDADLSHNPNDIPALLEKLNQGSDYVIGSRYTIGGAIDDSWPLSRIIISRVANFVARKLVGIPDDIRDVTGGYKAIRRTALEKIDLDKLSARGYVFQVSLLHAFLQQSSRVDEIPVTFTKRQYGASKLRLRDIIEFAYRAYKLNPNAPIQRFARFGLVGACGTVVNLAVLAFLVNFVHVNVLLSVAIAIEVSIIFNFFLNHLYTFKGYGAYKKHSQKDPLAKLLAKLVKFNLGALGGATISFSTFTLLYKLADIHYLLADVVAIILAMSWNYYMSTRYVWKAID